MSQENRPFSTGTVIAATAASIGFCFVITKYRAPILNSLKFFMSYKDPLRNQQIQVVSSVEECRTLMRNLKTYIIFVSQ